MNVPGHCFPEEGYLNQVVFIKSMNLQLKVKGMHCKSCEMLLKDSLEELPGVRVLNVDHKKGLLEVEAEQAQLEQMKAAIRKEGYHV